MILNTPQKHEFGTLLFATSHLMPVSTKDQSFTGYHKKGLPKFTQTLHPLTSVASTVFMFFPRATVSFCVIGSMTIKNAIHVLLKFVSFALGARLHSELWTLLPTKALDAAYQARTGYLVAECCRMLQNVAELQTSRFSFFPNQESRCSWPCKPRLDVLDGHIGTFDEHCTLCFCWSCNCFGVFWIPSLGFGMQDSDDFRSCSECGPPDAYGHGQMSSEFRILIQICSSDQAVQSCSYLQLLCSVVLIFVKLHPMQCVIAAKRSWLSLKPWTAGPTLGDLSEHRACLASGQDDIQVECL